MRAATLCALGAASVSLSGCGVLPTGCAGVGAHSVEVTVIDSLTGAPAAAGAILLTYDLDKGGVRVDSAAGQTDTDVLSGSERTGRLSVVVRKSGYRDWSKADVTVRDGCPAIQTVRLIARLAQP